MTASLILFLLYTSEEIADCPRNTHSRCNSKCKEKSIPSIFQCLYRVPFHYTIHAVIKCTSGNQRNNRSYKKDVDVSLQILARISAYTSTIKPASNDGRKTFPQSPFPRRNTIQLINPPAAAKGRYFFFIWKRIPNPTEPRAPVISCITIVVFKAPAS